MDRGSVNVVVIVTSKYLIVCCVETGRDSVVMKTEADSNDITQYTHECDMMTTQLLICACSVTLCFILDDIANGP